MSLQRHHESRAVRSWVQVTNTLVCMKMTIGGGSSESRVASLSHSFPLAACSPLHLHRKWKLAHRVDWVEEDIAQCTAENIMRAKAAHTCLQASQVTGGVTRDWVPLHTWAKSRDQSIVRAQKKVSKGRPNTPPKIMHCGHGPSSVVWSHMWLRPQPNAISMNFYLCGFSHMVR